MTTIADAISALLNAQWNVGTGGVEPTYYVTDDLHKRPLDNVDYVLVQAYTHDMTPTPVNDIYENRTHHIELEVNTVTDDNRLKELADEVVRILNSVAITGVNWQKVIHRQNISNKQVPFFRERVRVSLLEIMASGTTAYGATTTTTLTTDHLIVNTDLKLVGFTADGIKDEDNMASDSATKLATQQSIKAYTTNSITTHTAVGAAHHALTLAASAPDVTATAALLNIVGAALMIGAANTTWYPCVFEQESAAGTVVSSGYTLRNVGATDHTMQFRLALPTNRGGLKFYLTGVRVGLFDADAGDYITSIIIYGVTFNTGTAVYTDNTDYTAVAAISTTFAAIDMSSYTGILVAMAIVATDAFDIDITYVDIQGYYDT